MPIADLITFAVLILSIIIHEVAHGYAANSLGDPTARLSGRLTLNPIPHIDPMGSIVLPALLIFTGSPILFGWAKPVPYNPYNLKNQRWGEAIVAVAGSATNLLLALIFVLVVRFGLQFGLNEATITFAAITAFTNLFLGLFNLFPFPPLDGFTTLRSALPWKLGRHLGRFEHWAQGAGIFALVMFLLIFSLLVADRFTDFVIWTFGWLIGTGI